MSRPCWRYGVATSSMSGRTRMNRIRFGRGFSIPLFLLAALAVLGKVRLTKCYPEAISSRRSSRVQNVPALPAALAANAARWTAKLAGVGIPCLRPKATISPLR